jgi:hypothetical protein
MQEAGEQAIEQGGALVQMDDVEAVPSHALGQPWRQRAIESRTARVNDDVESLLAQCQADRAELAEGADFNRVAARAQMPRQLRKHRLRPADAEPVDEQ